MYQNFYDLEQFSHQYSMDRRAATRLAVKVKLAGIVRRALRAQPAQIAAPEPAASFS